jgi:hypothetical protein
LDLIMSDPEDPELPPIDTDALTDAVSFDEIDAAMGIDPNASGDAHYRSFMEHEEKRLRAEKER